MNRKPYHLMTQAERLVERIKQNREIEKKVAEHEVKMSMTLQREFAEINAEDARRRKERGW